jgi:hypothetical protein
VKRRVKNRGEERSEKIGEEVELTCVRVLLFSCQVALSFYDLPCPAAVYQTTSSMRLHSCSIFESSGSVYSPQLPVFLFGSVSLSSIALCLEPFSSISRRVHVLCL